MITAGVRSGQPVAGPAWMSAPGATARAGALSISCVCRARPAGSLGHRALFLFVSGMRGVGRLLVDAALGQGGQLFVSRFFLIERGLQKLRSLSMSHGFRPGDERAVC